MKPQFEAARLVVQSYPVLIERIVEQRHLAHRIPHFSNAAVFDFFNEARNALTGEGPFGIEPDFLRPIVVQATVNYRAEAFLGAGLVIGTRVGRIGRTSFVLEQAMFKDSECAHLCDAIYTVLDRNGPTAIAGRLAAWLDLYKRASDQI